MIDIPSVLIDTIKEQRSVLFLGAGASQGAKHPRGKQIPQSDYLCEMICDKFFAGDLKQKSLAAVASMAISEVGLSEFQGYVRELFLPFEPADFHLLIPKFRWRAITTTNLDLIIEKTYEKVSNPLQKLVKTVKNGDNFDTRLNKETDPVGFYKLHGCIDYYTDSEIPFVLGSEQYASHDRNRDRFYKRFQDLGHEYPIIFIGYSISDPHIQRILFDLTDSNIRRPPFYLISPHISSIETRYWMGNNVITIEATFEDFLNTLDQSIPPITRALRIGIGGGELSIRKHYHTAQATEPDFVAQYLDTNALHIHSGLVAPRQDPEEFYRGYDNGWGCIIQNLDARRSLSDSVLVDAILLSEENRRAVELFMLKGPGGNGKSVSLKRIAWEAGVTYDQLVLYPSGAAGLGIEPLAEIYRLTGKRIFLFVDHVALVRNELRELLLAARSQSIPLSIVGTERDNEWNIYCEQLEPFVRQEFSVRYLNEQEIKELLNLLERHNALGLLEELAFEDRVSKFVEAAERQLLVALHEATHGVPFEDIVVDEFRRIEPEDARRLYLDICALHQFGVSVRAGLISRASGIRFEQFQSEFLQPLENVVHVIKDHPNRDVHYRSRHQHVAEIVFNRIVSAVEDKFDLLVRLLKVMNVDYSSDRETFSQLIRGRDVAELFPSVDLGRLFYDHVQEAVPNDPFTWHQRAVFEMRHRGGSLVRAEEAAARAFELNPGSHSIQHTQAEVARRRANDTDDPLRKRSLRQITREKLSDTSSVSEYDLDTYARLAIDELKELLASLEMPDDGPPPRAFLEAVKATETTIQRGLQMFPESSQLLTTESNFRECLDQTDRAQQALERAFNLNPRQDWLAVRLAKRYQASGDLQKAKHVLEICLGDNPSSKPAHLEIGRVLLASGNSNTAIEHLKRGFTEGDNRYEAQFWYARELFLQNCFEEADRMFAAINDRAPGRFRTQSTAVVERDSNPVRYDCQVERKENGYAFLKIPQFPKAVFASRADSDSGEWDALCRGARVTCGLAFNRRGVRAISVRLADC